MSHHPYPAELGKALIYEGLRKEGCQTLENLDFKMESQETRTKLKNTV